MPRKYGATPSLMNYGMNTLISLTFKEVRQGGTVGQSRCAVPSARHSPKDAATSHQPHKKAAEPFQNISEGNQS